MSFRSPLIWFGGKGNHKGKLLPHFPPHCCYAEVFGGGASLLLAKDPASVEVYNDIDGDLIAFFRLLQCPDDFEKFQFKCETTAYSRDHFEECLETWKEQEDPVEKVYRWFCLARMSFNGLVGNKGWSTAVVRNRAQAWRDTVEMLPEIVYRLRRVQIDNDDWEVILDRYDNPDTFFYLDPPYVPSTRKSGGYNHELDESDHERLVEKIQTLEAKVLLSGYDNPIYEGLGWERTDYETTCYSAHNKHNKGKPHKSERIESVWYNYDMNPQQSLFTLEA